MVEEMRSLVDPRVHGAPRRLHLHFFAPPQEVLGTDRVEGLRIKTGDGTEDLPVGLVFRSIGYLGVPVPACRSTRHNKIVPTADHRWSVARSGSASTPPAGSSAAPPA